MKRFFVGCINNPHKLCGDEHKHLAVVLRAKQGEEVILCTGDGIDRIYRIDEITRNYTVLSLVRTEQNASEPSIDVTLFSSVMKGDKNDLVVQKAVELGAYEIYPLVTEHVQNFGLQKTDRLNKIALEASCQCGRGRLTAVHDRIDFDKMMSMLPEFDAVLFPYEKAVAKSLKEYLHTDCANMSLRKIALIIGSEGGFSDSEAQRLSAAGVVPLTLGKRILRAETANIAVLAAVMYELEQWK